MDCTAELTKQFFVHISIWLFNEQQTYLSIIQPASNGLRDCSVSAQPVRRPAQNYVELAALSRFEHSQVSGLPLCATAHISIVGYNRAVQLTRQFLTIV